VVPLVPALLAEGLVPAVPLAEGLLEALPLADEVPAVLLEVELAVAAGPARQTVPCQLAWESTVWK